MPVLRLAAWLACVALATSRFGLIAHELVGHGGAALAVGGHVTAVRLFWFAGGWITYELSDPSLAKYLAIAMGGIAVELACGGALMALARSRITRGIGAALVVHASWYLASGAWSGFGDGQLLYRVLGDARYAVALAAGAVTCAAAFLGARGVFGALVQTLPRDRVAGTLVAIALAAGANAALAFGELHVRSDATYTAIMRPAAHHVVPFGPVLALCASIAATIGAFRSPRGEVQAHSIHRAAAVAAVAVGAVIALGLLC